MVFSSSGKLFAAADRAGRVHFWQLGGSSSKPSVESNGSFHVHGEVLALAFSMEKGLAVATSDKVVLLAVPVLQEVATLPQSGDIQELCFSPDGAFMVVSGVNVDARSSLLAEEGDLSAGVVFWEVSGAFKRLGSMIFQQMIRVTTFRPDGRYLAVAGDNKLISLVDVLNDFDHEGDLPCSHTVRALAWSPNLRCLASGGEDHLVTVWDLASKHILFQMEPMKVCLGLMRSFQVLPGAGAGASGTSEEELPRNAQGLGSGASRKWVVLLPLLGLALLGLASTLAVRRIRCGDPEALEGKAQIDVSSALRRAESQLLRAAAAANRSSAEERVVKAMQKAGKHAHAQWEKHHIRKLDTLQVLGDIKAYKKTQNTRVAKRAECAFNLLESFLSVVAMGDDLNGILRTCPPPRDGESELACQVDGSILVAWVGNLATKLALAATNCALSLNVDAVCAAGVTGLVSAFGELSAGAALGSATCRTTPVPLSTTEISQLGDTSLKGRRLLIGQGEVGNGVQCAVDVGMVAANLANLGMAINKAVNVHDCKKSTFKRPLNVLKGIPEAWCTVDIGGAVAYISQVVTFINFIVVHCEDFLDINALCAGSIAAITTGAAAVAPYGAAIHVGCRHNALMKNPQELQKIEEMWVLPTAALPRRLAETPPLAESLATLARTRTAARAMGLNVSGDMAQTDAETLLNLMSAGLEETRRPRAAWPFEC
ncbi:Uncharacterized WD repeat-containing protein alr3466 [Durusdinium trenchii]|uniref:Uncharacterized WD repeat-containing protein alr3466 n=1 Tax=Durusdinium trenchii TaxID=1381693 RepID=A0ABP0ICT8_9DINO